MNDTACQIRARTRCRASLEKDERRLPPFPRQAEEQPGRVNKSGHLPGVPLTWRAAPGFPIDAQPTSQLDPIQAPARKASYVF